VSHRVSDGGAHHCTPCTILRGGNDVTVTGHQRPTMAWRARYSIALQSATRDNNAVMAHVYRSRG
jgi:hypothetical protein